MMMTMIVHFHRAFSMAECLRVQIAALQSMKVKIIDASLLFYVQRLPITRHLSPSKDSDKVAFW